MCVCVCICVCYIQINNLLPFLGICEVHRNNRNKYWQPNPLFNLVIPNNYE